VGFFRIGEVKTEDSGQQIWARESVVDQQKAATKMAGSSLGLFILIVPSNFWRHCPGADILGIKVVA
jgi:hypothetical protein